MFGQIRPSTLRIGYFALRHEKKRASSSSCAACMCMYEVRACVCMCGCLCLHTSKRVVCVWCAMLYWWVCVCILFGACGLTPRLGCDSGASASASVMVYKLHVSKKQGLYLQCISV